MNREPLPLVSGGNGLNLLVIAVLFSLGAGAAKAETPTIGNGEIEWRHFIDNTPHIIDGMGTKARFGFPEGLATDAAGNVYVADTDEEVIRKITPDGLVTTLAGRAYREGSVDGVGKEATFNSPSGIAVDRSGNLYVTDKGSHTIRKITPNGVVSTLAGSPGKPGSNDGQGSAARFLWPEAIAVDSSGNIYVGSMQDGWIKKITPGGSVTTLISLEHPVGGIAVDQFGTVFFSVPNSIHKLVPAGAGKELKREFVAAGFAAPHGLAVDKSGNVYVADWNGQAVRKVTPSGKVTILAGLSCQAGSADGTGSEARFAGPQGVAVDASGNVYVADTANSTIRKITPDGVVITFAGFCKRPGN